MAPARPAERTLQRQQSAARLRKPPARRALSPTSQRPLYPPSVWARPLRDRRWPARGRFRSAPCTRPPVKKRLAAVRDVPAGTTRAALARFTLGIPRPALDFVQVRRRRAPPASSYKRRGLSQLPARP